MFTPTCRFGLQYMLSNTPALSEAGTQNGHYQKFGIGRWGGKQQDIFQPGNQPGKMISNTFSLTPFRQKKKEYNPSEENLDIPAFLRRQVE